MNRRQTLIAIDIIIGIVLAIVLALIIWKFPSLDEKLPTHFNLDGTPNGYSGRASIFIMFGIAALIYGLMIFLQLNPQLTKIPIPTDNAGNPVTLTKGQWQRHMKLSTIMSTAALSVVIITICYATLGICQFYVAHPTCAIFTVVAELVIVTIYTIKMRRISFAEDDIIRTKIESSHSLFLAKADNTILEELRIINGSAYLPENKRLQLINDIKSTHIEIVDYIRNVAPAISDDDITYCLLSSIGLNNNSISACMASSEEALRKRKSRIRKKLPDTLAAYLLDEGKGI